MSLFIASLNSGSNGNCYYVGNDQEAVLVDVGISCREVERRMQRLHLDVRKVRAIFISHEHTDHISGVAVTANKYNLPVYITASTFRHACIRLNVPVISFNAVHPVVIDGLSVHAFPKHHDASDPHSFVVTSSTGVSIGIFTDIGNPCRELVYHFRQCHGAFLESNYDEEMLMKGRYPYFLKKRISGGLGHLSNTQAFQLFTEHRSSFMSHLLLSHLSKENNCPRLVEELFRSNAGSTNIFVASRYEETPVFEVSANSRNNYIHPFYSQQQQRIQLSLF